MKKVIVTGSAGLIGAESVRFFAEKGYGIIGDADGGRSAW